MNEEKRQSPRLNTECPVDYRSSTSWQYVSIKNISANGIFIASDNPEKPGTQATLDFRFGRIPELITAEGQVIWSRYDQTDARTSTSEGCGMGIMFTKISEHAKKRLSDEIARLLGDTASPAY